MSDIKECFETNNIRDKITLIKNFVLELNKKGITDELEIELKVMDEFKEFQTQYPFLVKKICKNDNISFLYKMLEQLDVVESGQNSFIDVEKDLANTLAEQYLYKNQ
jgi:soluble cytochrome b562